MRINLYQLFRNKMFITKNSSKTPHLFKKLKQTVNNYTKCIWCLLHIKMMV